ncbi:hypothetical protein QJQ45_028415, partial [Haematococcus lacustris]
YTTLTRIHDTNPCNWFNGKPVVQWQTKHKNNNKNNNNKSTKESVVFKSPSSSITYASGRMAEPSLLEEALDAVGLPACTLAGLQDPDCTRTLCQMNVMGASFIRVMQPMFILRHLVHAQKASADAKHRKLFTAFIDFKQAYDHIPRQQLWEHLRNTCGVKLPQPLLACLEGLYRDDNYVLIDGPHRTPPVTPDQGVKQGCPISPLLFALYVHDISKEFLGPVDAVRVQGTPVTHFMYADDLSTSSHGLQRLVREFKYLGMHFNPSATPAFAATHMRAGMFFAMRQACKRATEYGVLHDPYALCHLIRAFVLPLGLYGSQVWGTAFLGHGVQLSNPVQTRMLSFLRFAARVRASGSGQHDQGQGQAVKKVIAERRQVIKAAIRGLVVAARPDLSPAQVDAVVAEVNKRMTMGSKQCCLAAILGLAVLLQSFLGQPTPGFPAASPAPGPPPPPDPACPPYSHPRLPPRTSPRSAAAPAQLPPPVQLNILDPQLLVQIRDAMELITKASVQEHLMRGPQHRGIRLLPGEVAVFEQPSSAWTVAMLKQLQPGPDRLVIVDEFRTSRVSSSVHARQPCELHLPPNQPRPADWVPPAGQVNPRLVRPAWSLRHAKYVRGLSWCHQVPPNHPPPALAQGPPAPAQGPPAPAQDPPAPAQPPHPPPAQAPPPPAPAQTPPPPQAQDPPAPAQAPPPPPHAQAPPAQAQPPPPAQAQPPPAAPGPAPLPQAPPGGRWLDRDTNGCLNLQRIGESRQRPIELCRWDDLEALPPIGKEYQQGYKLVNDRLPKGRQWLHRAAEYRRGIDGRARNNAWALVILPVVREFKYLGMHFNPSATPAFAATHMRAGMFFAMRQACKRAREYGVLHDPYALCHLIRAFVLPLGLYGSQVWGTAFLGHGVQLSNPVQTRMLSFLRFAARVRSSVSGLMVLHELGQLPLQLYWLRAACKFWNTAKLSHSDLLMRVIKADVELGRSCQTSWSAQFQLAVRELMGGEFTLSPDMVLGTKAMEVKWLERWGRRWVGFEGDPRLPETVHRERCSYAAWFKNGDGIGINHMAPHLLNRQLSTEVRTSLTRFRLGNNGLGVEKARFEGVTFIDRTCTRCTEGVVDDAMHFIFECTATSSIREQPEFAMTLQNNNENLHDFMLSPCAPLFEHLALKCVTESPEPLEGEGGLAA